MDTALLLTVLDKYGPLGAAVAILCVVIWLLVTRVIPMVAEANAKRMDSLVDVLRESSGKLETHETNAERRHGEVMGGIKGLGEKIEQTRETRP